MSAEQKGWHMSKAISVSHLATTAALVMSVVLYVTSIEKDVAVLQSNVDTIKTQSERVQAENKEMFNRIDDKLDQMIGIIHSYKSYE